MSLAGRMTDCKVCGYSERYDTHYRVCNYCGYDTAKQKEEPQMMCVICDQPANNSSWDKHAGGFVCTACQGDKVDDMPVGNYEPIKAIKYDQGKPRFDLIPPEMLTALSTIITFGANKYGVRNWEQGDMEYSRIFNALMRHMLAWWSREDLDPETGKSHLWHAACNIAFLVTYEAREIGIDDRP